MSWSWSSTTNQSIQADISAQKRTQRASSNCCSTDQKTVAALAADMATQHHWSQPYVPLNTHLFKVVKNLCLAISIPIARDGQPGTLKMPANLHITKIVAAAVVLRGQTGCGGLEVNY